MRQCKQYQLILIKMSQKCKAEGDWEHSTNAKTPTPRNQPMKEEKIVDKKKKERKKSSFKWSKFGFIMCTYLLLNNLFILKYKWCRFGKQESIGSALKTLKTQGH